MRRSMSRLLLTLFAVAVLTGSFAVTTAAAAPEVRSAQARAGIARAWTPTYSGYTPYDQIQGILDELVAQSDRVRYEVMGTSAGGRDLFLVVVARPDVLARLDEQHAFRDLMLSDPAAAQARLQDGEDVPAPVFVNCSIHGNEPNGTDAGLDMLRRLALSDDDETREILDECVVLFNICQNPDGRVNDVRANSNGFDLNRDFLLLTQPETQATAREIERWLPMVFFDLHGYYGKMRIDPCTPPHNPNYEYDLFIKWALPQALEMRDAVKAATRQPVNIPYLDMQAGFEDYSPFYTPQFAMYFGALGMTLETFAESDLGTLGHSSAVWAGTLYAARHKDAMLFDQIEQFRRGVVGYQQDDVDFPGAYVIPAQAPVQRSPLEAARMIDFMVAAGVEVYRADAAFDVPTPGPAGTLVTRYPAGTYVVPLRQPLRGLVNTWLWDGEDVSYMTNAMYSVCATSLPWLMGFDRAIVPGPVSTAPLTRVSGAAWPTGGIGAGDGDQYLMANDSNNAVRAANELLAAGATVKITTSTTSTAPAGTFVVGDTTTSTLDAVATRNRVVLTPTTEAPAPAKTLHPVKLGVYGTADVRWILDDLGFEFTTLGATSSLSSYDVVLGNRTALTASTLKRYVSGGGAYVGIGFDGTSGPLGNLLPVTINVTNAYDNNAIVEARYRSAGLVGAYFTADDHAFVYRPIWYTSVGARAKVEARYGNDDDWFVSGYWRDRAGAKGKPAVVSGPYGDGEVVYIGFEPAYRAYPEGQYRLMANAIWFGME
jgi:hypothetical protein